LARKLREKRFKNGAINFESEEVRFRFDENAVPIEAFVKEQKEANLLVEDFMLLANTTVAKFFSKLEIKNKNLAGVYRVHDKPDEGKLEQLASIARRFGYTFKFEDESQIRSALNNLMEILKGKPAMNVLSSLAVRSMAKAEYTTKNIGHYGLSYEYYTHFTSPIRRYPDVLVHRLLLEKMMKHKPFYTREQLEELCQQSSMMERKAQSAEREGIKYKQVEFLQDKIGQEFEGVISGVISRGLFIELSDNKCEGFASLSEFDDDFVYEEELIRLVGRTTKVVFQIGDKVKVALLKADLKEKKIEFDVIAKMED
jgi:ribonuclease R